MDYFAITPPEITKNIFDNLPLFDLIKMETVKRQFTKFVRETKWDHKVKLWNSINFFEEDPMNLEHVIKTHKFTTYSFNEITDKLVNLLGHCTSIEFNRCHQITNKSVSKLTNLRELHLNYCYGLGLTAKCLTNLTKLEILSFAILNETLDQSLSLLTNLRKLNMNNISNFTGTGLKFLTNLSELKITSYKVTAETEKSLRDDLKSCVITVSRPNPACGY